MQVTSVLKVGAQVTLPNLSELFLNEWGEIIFSGKPMMCRFVYNNFLVDYIRGGVGHKASDFHFNVPGFKSRFGHENFSSRFRVFLQVWHHQDLR
jgi:hypothetical protein